MSASRAPRRMVLVATAAALLVSGLALPASASVPLASPSPSPSTSADSSGAATGQATFGLGPSKNGIVDGRAGFSFLAPRGGSVSDELTVINLSYSPLTLNLYPADALNAEDGSLGIAARSEKPKDLAAWVTLKTPTGKLFVVVPPRGKVAVPVTVRVPKNAFVGDHLSGIAASIVAQGTTPGERGTNVGFEQRVAVRLAMRVAGQLTPGLSVTDVTAAYAGTLNPFGRGSAVVTYTVTNTGNARVQGGQSVTVSGLWGGDSSPRELGDVPLLLPGSSAHVTVEVPDVVPAVAMSATVVVSGSGAPGDATPPVLEASASTRFWAVPWTLIALVLLVLGAAGYYWRLRRRRAASVPEGTRSRSAAKGPLTGVGS